MAVMMLRFSAALVPLFALMPSAALAVDGYWLDQYNLLLHMSMLRLDTELMEMREQGADVVMVHADSLPDPLLRWVAWRARRAELKPVAWIQRPTPANLKRVGALSSFMALQVDDHFFARPPVEISTLKVSLAPRQLCCSFQPGQYSWRTARHCDHIDIQLYRQTCRSAVDNTYRLGIAGRRDTAIAVYHDGSADSDRLLSCFRREIGAIGNRLFVFKWKNPEYWLTPLIRRFWQLVSRIS